MKKIICLACCLLALATCFASCESRGSTNAATTVATTAANVSVDPATIVGSWYAADGLAVLDLRADGTLTYYHIQPGYYHYNNTREATYRVEGDTLTLTLDGTDIPLTWDPAAATFSTTEKIVFSRVDVLPEEHPVYTFPDYTKIDCASVITLGAYKGLTPDEAVKPNAVLSLFNDYYTANKDKTPSKITEDRGAAYGDRVVIDYVGKLDGVAFQGGSANDQTIDIVTDSGYIPGFVEGIVGHKIGETFDINVTFPENYGATDLAGKAVVFTMTLDTIYELTIPDADIAAYTKEDATPYTTYQQLLQVYIDDAATSDLWKQITNSTDYKALPEECYLYFYQYYTDFYRSYAFSYGMDYNTFLQSMVGTTDAELLEDAKKAALPYVISNAIYKAESLQWTQEKYDRLFATFVADAMEYFEYTEEEAKNYVQNEEYGNFIASLIYETVSAWILENNK